ncbi:putative bifunctional diguanylate cyclase/phosphodiesterase [Hyphococcus luteus]|nr:EAL domain-containing protein [Marinicaulis flavus]
MIKKFEFWLVIAVSVILAEVCIYFEAFEALASFVENHESWELDEFIIFFLAGGVASMILLVFRAMELRAEVKRRQNAEEKATRLARHDTLTGLPNRRVLTEELETALESVRVSGGECAVFLIDLDHFKPVNDVYGHAAGDALLIEVAKRIKAVVGKQGVVARLGGDEFASVIPYEAGGDLPNRLAAQIVRNMNQAFYIEGARVQIGSTVGIACAPRDGATASALLHSADLAMYEGKRAGRGGHRFFHAEMDDRLRERTALENDLRKAIADNVIIPYFQPVTELSDGKITGFEALARWPHPTRGMISPEVFVPIAEDLGLIDQICSSILRASCTVARDWPKPMTLSVNISPMQLKDPWLSTQILAILTETGFPPNRLIVEVTENAIIEDLDKAREVFQSLQNVGVRIALDDFGKGYSSLYHLRQLNFDHLKIDGSFVHAMNSPESAKIVSAVAGLGKSLGMPVTAEGVETTGEADRLRALGCEQAQGFLFGRPLDAVETAALLRGEANNVIRIDRSA